MWVTSRGRLPPPHDSHELPQESLDQDTLIQVFWDCLEDIDVDSLLISDGRIRPLSLYGVRPVVAGESSPLAPTYTHGRTL